MGDAGPPTPLTEEETQVPATEEQHIREIHVLVTGFGPFKSFTINPSWLIASSLPTELPPLPPSQSDSQDPTAHPHYPFSSLRKQSQEDGTLSPQPVRPPNQKPYRIVLHTYPQPVRVAYAPTAALIPSLLNQATNRDRTNYDYILHIGLASGRDSYTLETLAHRADYLIPDVDEGTGERVSDIWLRENVPEALHVGWHPQDVLRRWEGEVARQQDDSNPAIKRSTNDISAASSRQDEQRSGNPGVLREWMASHGMLLRPAPSSAMPMAGASRRPQKIAVVKLSRDAGRFLCEFILMCSLVQRYLEATSASASTASPKTEDDLPTPSGSDSLAREKLGKVAFLHVPNGIEKADVARGRMVAESAIRSLVASWEEGYRNPMVYGAASTAVDGKGTGVESEEVKEKVMNEVAAGFEDKGTGDAIPQDVRIVL